MCGIIGLIGNTPKNRWAESHRILTHLFLAAESRGFDATGFAAQTESNRTILEKDAVRSSEFVESNSAWRSLIHRRCSMVLGHVRWATHGEPTDPRNAHPHSSGTLSLVHNGIVANHRELNDRYCLRVESECDSEVLLRIIERAKNPPVGISLCLREKPGAIVVMDSRHDCVWVGRDESRPLWIGRLQHDWRLWIASTPTILKSALHNVIGTSFSFELLMPVPADHVFRISPDGAITESYENQASRHLEEYF